MKPSNIKQSVIPLVATLCLAAAAFVRSESHGIGIGLNPAPVKTIGGSESPDTRRPSLGDRLRRIVNSNSGEALSKSISSDSPPAGLVAQPIPEHPQQQETRYLKEIARKLSIPVSDADTLGDVASKIERRLDKTARYSGTVFSEDSFKMAKSAILLSSDAEIFADYHAFIKKIAGKRILILETDE